MAIYEKGNTYGKLSLRDGARGFGAIDKERINRSNHTLNTAAHETTNIKYGLDDRLKVEFKYGYADGYNQMIIPKGRVVAVDPYLQIFDADTQKLDNALTLANGGVNVKFEDNQWVEDTTLFTPNDTDGRNSAAGSADTTRPANIPIGIALRNEYTRDVDAFNGITPGAVNTDCMVELPYFVDPVKAKATPWGSAYAGVNKSLRPGDLVKADTTGRIVLSPLSDIDTFFGEVNNVAKLKEYELERQQIIGQVYEVKKDLVPMGAAKYAQWALSDILEFEEFNPDVKRKTNRRGEDNIENTAYQTTGKAPFGYEKGFNESDLHMLGLGNAGSRTAYNKRMQHKYRFDFGIPGLTDGYNSVKNRITGENLGVVRTVAGLTKEKKPVHTLKTIHTNVYDEIVTTPASAGVQEVTERAINITVSTVEENGNRTPIGTTKITAAQLKALNSTSVPLSTSGLSLVYFNAMQGILQVKQTNDAATNLELTIDYTKRGEAGVPTHLDWDGCVGTVKILLQK